LNLLFFNILILTADGFYHYDGPLIFMGKQSKRHFS
jgi:hypothetical protein